ncbi:putative E3 ubiquitin ligase SUD1 [Podospora conica]|nr:putative E3 ubiquitin ligase SUD1 [Schizothecium conicum]
MAEPSAFGPGPGPGSGHGSIHGPLPEPDPTRFPNTRPRTSTAGTAVHDASLASADLALAHDPDTCRICRGEATPDEPLFYPCKCSGSIKYVHQDCLMEWLSHSQKKHCELCKTPFRFTKLYAPDMPTTLPFHVFLKHVAKYTIGNILVWLRAALVASVWLGWLPYLMRSVWSFLFWISDEGLGGGSSFFGRSSGGWRGTSDAPGIDFSGVCPASPLFVSTTTAATVGGVVDGLSHDSMRVLRGLYKFNFTADPLKSTILRLLFGSVGLGDRTDTLPAATSSSMERAIAASKFPPSLLSDVTFLRNLTRHASINRTVIATFEGQIITILVIVCFILIILVRDYVVQQQPDIMRAGAFAPADNAMPLPVPPAHLVAPDAHEEHQDRGAEAEPEEEGEFHYYHATADMVIQWNSEDEQEQGSGPAEGAQEDMSGATLDHRPSHGDLGARPSSSRRIPDPAIVGDMDKATAQEYLTFYRETGGDPEKMMEMARNLNMEDKLDYWIRLTKAKTTIPSTSEGAASTGEGAEELAELSVAAQASTRAPSHPSSEWVWPEEGMGVDAADPKGKGKLVEEPEVEDRDASSFPRGNALRPRAYTDGPSVTGGPNPLGHNNWSFEDVSGEGLSSFEPPAGPSMSAQMLPEFGPPRSAAPLPEETQSPAPRGLSESQDTPHIGAEGWQSVGESAAGPSHQESPPVAAEVEDLAPRTSEDDARPPPEQPAGLFNFVADFMFRDVNAIDPDELAAGPFGFPFFDDEQEEDDDAGDGGPPAEEMWRDREAVEAVEFPVPAMDPDAIDDAEDLEGILELLGMRGPIASLFQNAIFCAFLVSITIFIGVFVPYNIGRMTVWTVANPMRPARMMFSLSKFIQDCAVILAGITSCVASMSIQLVAWLANLSSIAAYFSRLTATSWSMAVTASNRIGSSFLTELPIISASEMRNFSAISHEALLSIRGHIALAFSTLGRAIMFLFGGDYSGKGSEAIATVANVSAMAWGGVRAIPGAVANPSTWVINLNVSEPATIINPELAFWNGTDRFWAIISGYLAMSMMAGLYLRRGTPFSSSQAAQEWENALIDLLNQASGVMKVILIIGIEMLVFPLYCGILLDLALLPLFEGTTVKSRVLFTLTYPVTSIFVHWFVGTGYMFHFALFVSMCRKIMRKGVLYFIRDPDDPDFHPVRDVLDRSVTTQLRKILFSALVYGALVIVCLGGVVWGLALSLPSVLPIHYSSNEPVLEFPIDLLFYNFLMPLAVSFFRPSDGLHAMYTWWFRKCARVLRISWFLFGERMVDEEGHLRLKPDSPHAKAPWWKTLFLEIDEAGEVVPKTWSDLFEGGEAEPTPEIPADEMIKMKIWKFKLVQSGELIPDGRFVRTPASDQVKIPKGQRVFLEVDEDNIRRQGREVDLYSTNQYQLVYVPPHFRARIFSFILLIWVFAAATGVGITIVPLVFGRRMFKLLLPDHVRTNDIYAFSIGVYTLSTAIWTLFRLRSMYAATKTWLSTIGAAYHRDMVRQVVRVVSPVVKVLYAYFFLFIVFPLMVASLVEIYAVIPMHELMYGGLIEGEFSPAPAGSDPSAALNPQHTVRVVQSWTVGLLYLKLGTRIVVRWCDNTRLAAAILAVLRRGWLDPDVLILTRAFVVPGMALWAAAIVAPVMLARFLVAGGWAESLMQMTGHVMSDDAQRQQLYDACVVFVYRLSFPLVALLVAAAATLWSTIGVFRIWKVRIRDEAYLIGERLHNFGVVNVQPKARGGWRANGARL